MLVRGWRNWNPLILLVKMKHVSAIVKHSLVGPQKLKQNCHVIQQFHSTDGWIDKISYIQITEYYSSIKNNWLLTCYMNEPLKQYGKWKATYYMITFIWKIKNRKSTEIESRLIVVRHQESGKMGIKCLIYLEFSFRVIKMF